MLNFSDECYASFDEKKVYDFNLFRLFKQFDTVDHEVLCKKQLNAMNYVALSLSG